MEISSLRAGILDILQNSNLSNAEKAAAINQLKNIANANSNQSVGGNSPSGNAGQDSDQTDNGKYQGQGQGQGQGQDGNSNNKNDNLDTLENDVDNAKKSAEQAKKSAEQAKKAADNLKRAADNAKSKSDNLNTSGSAAGKDKADAQKDAIQKQHDANEAINAATEAESMANDAINEANTASDNLNKIKQNIKDGKNISSEDIKNTADAADKSSGSSNQSISASNAVRSMSQPFDMSSEIGQSGQSGQQQSGQSAMQNQSGQSGQQQSSNQSSNQSNDTNDIASNTQQIADNIQSIASQIQQMANEAQQMANEAQPDNTAEQQNADQLQQLADEAQQLADEAQQNADNAFNTNNESTAQSEQQDAMQKQVDAENLQNTANNISQQNKNQQNKNTKQSSTNQKQGGNSNPYGETNSQDYANGWNDAVDKANAIKAKPLLKPNDGTDYNKGWNDAVAQMSVEDKQQQSGNQNTNNSSNNPNSTDKQSSTNNELKEPPKFRDDGTEYTSSDEEFDAGVMFGELYAEQMFKNGGRKIVLPDKFNYDLPDIEDMLLLTNESASDMNFTSIEDILLSGLDDERKSIAIENLLKIHGQEVDEVGDSDENSVHDDPIIGFAGGESLEDYDWANHQDVITKELGAEIRDRNGYKDKKTYRDINSDQNESDNAIKLRGRIAALDDVFSKGDREWRKDASGCVNSITERITQNNTYVEPWGDILRKFMTGAFSGYKKELLNKKYLARFGVSKYRKVAHYDNIERITVFVDTSGSIWDSLSYLTAEISGIAKEVDCETMDIHLFCHRVYESKWDMDPDEVSDDKWSLSNAGSGNTEVTSVYDFLMREYYMDDRDPGYVIIFTDGDILGSGESVVDFLKNKTIDGPKKKCIESLEGKAFYGIFANYRSVKTIQQKLPKQIIPESMFAVITPDQISKGTNESLKSKYMNNKLYEAGKWKTAEERKKEVRAAAEMDQEERKQVLNKINIRTARDSGTLQEYAKEIYNWVAANFRNYKLIDDTTALLSDKDITPRWSLSDSMKISVSALKSGHIFSASTKPNISSPLPEYIDLDKFYGDLKIKGSNLVSIPDGFFKSVIRGNIIIENCPNLSDLSNLPLLTGSDANDYEVIIRGCPKLAREEINKYEARAERQFYDIEITNEGLNMKKYNNIAKLIESRISLGKAYLNENYTLNEAFASSILNDLYSKNRDIMPKITSIMPVAWNEITDELLSTYEDYGVVKKIFSERKDINKQSGMYGIQIYTDANDRINCVVAGKDIRKANVYINPAATQLFPARLQLLSLIKQTFKAYNLDTANGLRGSYVKDKERVSVATFQKYLMSFAYYFLCWLNNGEHNNYTCSRYWVKNNNMNINYQSSSLFSDIISYFGKSARYINWSANDYDREKFFNEFAYTNIGDMFDSTLLKTFIMAVNIRTTDQGLPIYTQQDILTGDPYTKFVELRDLNVRDSFIYNIGVKIEKAPNSESLTDYNQLQLVPEYISKLYYIKVSVENRRIEDKIDTEEDRIENFNITSQERFIKELRKKRANTMLGAFPNKALSNNKRMSGSPLTDEQLRSANMMTSSDKPTDYNVWINPDGDGGTFKRLTDVLKSKVDKFADIVKLDSVAAARTSAQMQIDAETERINAVQDELDNAKVEYQNTPSRRNERAVIDLQDKFDNMKNRLDKVQADFDDDHIFATTYVNGVLDKAYKFLGRLIGKYNDVQDDLVNYKPIITADNIMETKYFDSHYISYEINKLYEKYLTDNNLPVVSPWRYHSTDEYKEFAAKYVLAQYKEDYQEMFNSIVNEFGIDKYYSTIVKACREIMMSIESNNSNAVSVINTKLDDISEVCSDIYKKYLVDGTREMARIARSVRLYKEFITEPK